MNSQTEIKNILQTWWNKDRHYTSLINDLQMEVTKSGSVSLNLYTETRRYRIVAKPDYLGCTMTNRRANVGENWIRGRDFPDGKFSYETWSDIIRSIGMYELTGNAGKIIDTMIENAVPKESPKCDGKHCYDEEKK